MSLIDLSANAAVEHFLTDGRLPEDDAAADSILLQALLNPSALRALDHLEQPSAAARVGLPSSPTFHSLLAAGRLNVIQYCLQSTSRRWNLPADSLAIAALHGHADLVKVLADHGFDASICGLFGTPLRSACLAGHHFAAQYLVDLGVPINDCTVFGSALEAAAMAGETALIELLCDRGADVDLKGGFFGSPLQAASYHGHTNAVKLLLDRGASPDCGHFAENALCAAAEGKSEDALLLMLQDGYIFKTAVTNSRCGRRSGGPRYVSVLRASSPSCNSETSYKAGAAQPDLPIPETAHIADAYRAIQIDKHFALNGCFPELPSAPSPSSGFVPNSSPSNAYRGARDVSILQVAAKNGLNQAVKVLLEHQICPKLFDNELSFALAAHVGLTKMLKNFENAGVDVLSYRKVALEAAAVAGHVHIIEYLLYVGGGLWSVSKDEVALLLKAGLAGKEQILRFAISLVFNFFAAADHRQIIEECLTSSAASVSDTITDALRPVCHLISRSCLEATYSSASCSGNSSGVKSVENLSIISSRTVPGRVQLRCLEEAALQGHTAVVKTILSALERADIGLTHAVNRSRLQHQQDIQSSKNRALIVAALKGDENSVLALLSQGANPNETDEIARDMKNGERPFNVRRTPLCAWPTRCTALQACLYGISGWPRASHECVLELLLKHGADVRGKIRASTSESSDYDSVSDASVEESFNTGSGDVSVGYSSGDDTYDEAYVKVEPAKGRKNNGVYQPRISTHSDIAKHYSSSVQAERPLRMALKYGSEKIIRLLVDAGANVKDNELLLAYSCREDATVETLHYLLDTGMPLSMDLQDQRNVLHSILSIFANEPCLQYTPGADPEGRLTKPVSVTWIIREGPGALAKEILQRSPSQRCVEPGSALLLQLAACAGDVSFVELLIDRGVNVNTASYYYGTPLQAASRHGHVNVVTALLKAGADVSILQGRWSTALRAAARAGNEQIVNTLLSAGADPRLKLEAEDPERSDFNRCPSVPIAHLAVRSGSVAVLQRLMDTGAPLLESASETDLSCVEAATISNNSEMVRIFLEACHTLTGHSQVWRQSAGMTAALRVACEKDSNVIVDLILKYGQVINKSKLNQRSALTTAVHQGNVRLVNRLLEGGADANTRDGRGEEPVLVAVANGDFVTLRSLLSQPISRESLQSALARTSYAKDNVQQLVKELTSPENKSYLADEKLRQMYSTAICDRGLSGADALTGMSLSEAISKAKEMAGRQTRRGMPSFDDYFAHAPRDVPALLLAAFAGSLSGVRMCLEHMELSCDAILALHIAVHRGHLAIVKLLLERGLNLQEAHYRFGSPLAVSVEGLQHALCDSKTLSEGGKSLVRECLPSETERSAFSKLHINYDKKTGKSWIRRMMECEEIFRLLKDAGAPLDQNIFDFSLHIASEHASSSLVELLLGLGADPNSIQEGGEPPLIHALQAKNWQHLPLLIKHGAELNYVSKQHGTALHFACQSDNATMTKFLLEHGADPNIRDMEGASALSKYFLSMRWATCQAGATIEHGTSCGDFLLRSSKRIQVESRDAEALIKRQTHSQDNGQWLKRLLALNPDLTFGSEALIAAMRAYILIRGEELGMFIEHADPECSPEELLREARTFEAVDQILRRFPKCKVTKEGIEAVGNGSRSASCDHMIIRRLLEHDQTTHVDGTTVLAILEKSGPRLDEPGKPHILDSLWARNPTMKVTDDMLVAVNLEKDAQALLSKRDPAIPISEPVMLGIARRAYPHHNGAGIARSFLKHSPQTRVPPDALFQSTRSGWTVHHEWLEVLFEHDPTLPVTEAMFLMAFESSTSGRFRASSEDRERLVRVFERYKIGLRYTPRMRRMVECGLQAQSEEPLKERFFALHVD